MSIEPKNKTVLRDGSRALTDNWDVGNKRVYNVSQMTLGGTENESKLHVKSDTASQKVLVLQNTDTTPQIKAYFKDASGFLGDFGYDLSISNTLLFKNDIGDFDIEAKAGNVINLKNKTVVAGDLKIGSNKLMGEGTEGLTIDADGDIHTYRNLLIPNEWYAQFGTNGSLNYYDSQESFDFRSLNSFFQMRDTLSFWTGLYASRTKRFEVSATKVETFVPFVAGGNIDLVGNKLVGNGGSVGIAISALGVVQLGNSLDMNTNKIIGLSAPLIGTDAVNKDYVDNLFQGLMHRDPVKDMLNTPPVSPITGDRYIVTAVATGDWIGQEDTIAEWNGSSWDFNTPEEGWTVWVNDVDTTYNYNGSSWVSLGSTTVHNNTSGLQGGTVSEYYHLTSAQHTIATQPASTSVSGYLSSSDWDVFNAKMSNLSDDITPQLSGNLDIQSYKVVGNGGSDGFIIASNGKISVTTVDYETLVTGDDDIPNRKFVIDQLSSLPTSIAAGSVLFSNGSNIVGDSSTFYWDNTSKRLGIKTNSPATAFHIVGELEDEKIITIEGYNGASAFGGGFSQKSARGTKDTPAYLQTGDYYANFDALPYAGTGFSVGGTIYFSATENHASDKRGTDFRLDLVKNGSTFISNVLHILNDGKAIHKSASGDLLTLEATASGTPINLLRFKDTDGNTAYVGFDSASDDHFRIVNQTSGNMYITTAGKLDMTSTSDRIYFGSSTYIYFNSGSYFDMTAATFIGMYSELRISENSLLVAGKTLGATITGGLYFNSNNDAIFTDEIISDLGDTDGNVPADGWHRLEVTAYESNGAITVASLPLDDESVYVIRAYTIGKTSAASDRAGYFSEGVFYRDAGGGATAQGSIINTTLGESDAQWFATMMTSSNNVIVQVGPGTSGDTIQWACYVEYMKIAGA